MMSTQKNALHHGQNICKGSIMDDKNELNDIVLNKTEGSKPAKKIILVIAVLVIILIIAISLVDAFSSKNKHHIQTTNQQTQLPTSSQNTSSNQNQLFQPAKVVTQNSNNASSTQTTTAALNKIAQQLKQQSLATVKTNSKANVQKQTHANMVKPSQHAHHQTTKITKSIKTTKHYSIKKLFATGDHYVQVGAFVRFHPSKKFLASIKRHGYSYIYKKQKINGKIFTKVLIGPFSKSQATKALANIRQEINHQAYIVKVK